MSPADSDNQEHGRPDRDHREHDRPEHDHPEHDHPEQDYHGDQPPGEGSPVGTPSSTGNPTTPAAGQDAETVPGASPETPGTHRENRREQTEVAATSRSEQRAPSPVESDIGAPAGPISFVRRREIEVIHQELEQAAGNRDRTLVGAQRYREALFANYFRPRVPFIDTWPDNVYIPAAADYLTYWSSPPPDDHRYRYRWSNTRDGEHDGSEASERSGQLFSWVNASAMDAGYIGFAGTGVALVPRASLSSVTVRADIELVAESRWWFHPTGPIGFAAFAFRGTAYVAGWEIDPVTGNWDLLTPFGSRTLFAFDESGRGGSPISSQRHAFSDLTTTLQLRGSHTYAIGVALEAQITFECRDKAGKPYTRKDGDDVRLWAAIAGLVPSITLTT